MSNLRTYIHILIIAAAVHRGENTPKETNLDETITYETAPIFRVVKRNRKPVNVFKVLTILTLNLLLIGVIVSMVIYFTEQRQKENLFNDFEAAKLSPVTITEKVFVSLEAIFDWTIETELDICRT